MRNDFLELVKANITEYEFHITFVQSSSVPRYAYTIGLFKKIGFELVFAGGVYFMKEAVFHIINSIAKRLIAQQSNSSDKIEIERLGTFHLKDVQHSWSTLMMLGVYDFYKEKNIKSYQIIPSKKYFTGDIPDMSQLFDATADLQWKWLKEKWNLTVPETSHVITNIKALQAQSITEMMRWENDEWEMFTEAGPDISPDDIRIVPLSTLLSIDKTVEIACNLDIGKGLWRESKENDWEPWG